LRRPPHIHADDFGASNRLKFLFLKHPQHFDLQLGTHIPDFIEKNGPPLAKTKRPADR
jgi:hypothetical protein